MNWKQVRSRAQLNPTDVSKLLGASRVAASMWFNGRAKPHFLHANKIKKLLDAIESAVETGDLPAPDKLTREDRFAHIEKVLKRHLRQTKEAAAEA